MKNTKNKNIGSFQKFVDKKSKKREIADDRNQLKKENKERKESRLKTKDAEESQFDVKTSHGKPLKPNPKNTKKEIEDIDSIPVSSEFMPLNKYLAHCGICSRRDAVDKIKNNEVEVNGAVITEPGFKVSDLDKIALKGEIIQRNRNFVYILLNKPKGFITTTDDPQGRKTVLDLVQTATTERIYPIGRLDRNTTGVLLLTNDGQFAQKLSHPSHQIKKIYHAILDKPLLEVDMSKIQAGLTLEDGPVAVDAIAYSNPSDKSEVGIEIHLGRNRIVRRIFEHLGYNVVKLDRVVFAGLTKKNVIRGKWRFLTKQEIITLKHIKKFSIE